MAAPAYTYTTAMNHMTLSKCVYILIAQQQHTSLISKQEHSAVQFTFLGSLIQCC